ncbi:unnamed protein product [Ophioblennius macclurei]
MEAHVALLWLMWYFQGFDVVAFNLDTEKVLQRNGDPGSLFGFSVAFHQQLNPTRKNLLLVGAPRAKHRNQVNVTGVVYQCDLSAESKRCQPIMFQSEKFRHTKGINNQWMGVRVASQGPGKNVMACAHRYQEWIPSQSLTHLLTGQCYLLNEDLQVGDEEHTWQRVVCDNEHLTRRHKNHEWFAYCQQGHGAAFAKDNKTLIFGAPGAYQWRGIVRMEPLDNLDYDSDEPRETGDIDQFNPNLIPLQISSYLGFSIDSGMALIGRDELTIVSGAPRGGYSGQVVFMKADAVAQRNLSIELVLSGPGLASSFGYDVAVVDLNGDGWDDLAVGAPQFFLKDRTVGGAVYIYINDKGKNWDKIVPTQLLGQKDSMFGLAVENIGDANQDGFGDIAVGAPYDGSGQVYLYYGSSNGIHKKPVQVLSSTSKNVKLFGYSLTGNLDIDDDHYPDLAVGSLSDSVFVFRARPVINVRTSLEMVPNEVDVTRQRCHEQTCVFTGKACFTYTARSASFNTKLTFNYTFEADSERKMSRARVTFQGSHQGKVELPGQGRVVCRDVAIQLLRDIEDKLSSIPVSITVSLSSRQKSSDGTDPLAVPPILNFYQRKSTLSAIILKNEGCGKDNVCQSNLQLKYKFCSRRTVDGRNVFTPLTTEDGVAVITPSEEDIALEITVTNADGDDAHQSHSVVTLPETLRYVSVALSSKATSHLGCIANTKGNLIDCEFGNPLRRDAEVTFYIILTTSGISLSTKHLNVTIQLETTSVQIMRPVEAFAKVVFELELQVYGRAVPSQVSLGQSVVGESAIKSKDEIGTSVRYKFRIINLGRPLNHFANASLNILWPKETSVGKWLLYLTHSSSRGIQLVPCSPASEVDPLKDVKVWNAVRRSRREAEALPVARFAPPLRKFKLLTCEDGLSCVEIRCPLLGLDTAAQLVLHAHLWNSTLSEDYSSLNYLEIVVDATLNLTDSPENIGFRSSNPATKVKLTVFFERKVELLTKVAWWIILLTVLVLLLMVVALIVLLWMRGCFHRFAPNKKTRHDGDPFEERTPLNG